MKIVLTGGGTGGSVASLSAIAEEIKKQKPETEFLFIGTRKGRPEREMIKDYNFHFQSIFAGKLRRYFSWQNFLDIFRIKIGFWQSLFILKKFKPNLIIGSGGYVSVPVIIAGWFLKIPSFIHQQDILPSLSNKILTPFVKKIFISFEPTVKYFPKSKTIFTGHPIREMILKGDKNQAYKSFQLENNKPVLLVIGGGTGALFLNNLIWQNLDELTNFCQIVHLTGFGKLSYQFKIKPGYRAIEFLDLKEIANLFTAADLVISRAGINVLAELAVLGKPIIIIPIPNSHQEANAKYFAERNSAIVLNQKELTSEKLITEIKKLIDDKEKQNQLGKNIKKIVSISAAEKIVKEIWNSLK